MSCSTILGSSSSLIERSSRETTDVCLRCFVSHSEAEPGWWAEKQRCPPGVVAPHPRQAPHELAESLTGGQSAHGRAHLRPPTKLRPMVGRTTIGLGRTQRKKANHSRFRLLSEKNQSLIGGQKCERPIYIYAWHIYYAKLLPRPTPTSSARHNFQ